MLFKILYDGTPAYVHGHGGVISVDYTLHEGDTITGIPMSIMINHPPKGKMSKINVIKIERAGKPNFIEAKNVELMGSFDGGSGFITNPKTKADKVMNASMVTGTIGFIGGLIYAFVHKKKFWGYVGYSLLGSVGGSAIGGTTAFVVIPKDTISADQKYSGMAGNKPNERGVKITLEQNPSGAKISEVVIPESKLIKKDVCSK
jgi:hypothetical protein